MQLKPEEMSTLSVLSKSNNAKPLFNLLGIVSTCVNKLMAECYGIDEKVLQIINLLKQIHDETYELALAYDAMRHEFEVDIDLHEQKNEYAVLDASIEKDYQLQLAAYNLSISKLSSELEELKQQLTAVKDKDDIGKLRSLGLYTTLHQEIEVQMAANEDNLGAPGCFQGFFCYMPGRVKHAQSIMRDLRNQLSLLESANVEIIQSVLMSRLEADIKSKQEEFTELIAKVPKRNDEYRHACINIEAQVRSSEREYYSCLNHELMLNLLKMHFILTKINKDIINPDGKALILDLTESFKAACFKFYCEEPGRYYFRDYLKNMKAIKDNTILNNIIVGDANEAEVRLVIPKYQLNSVALRMA